jgi:tetratricopeptide (TPR) repeat protein
MWKEAATMELYPLDQGWDKFPWQKAIFHFARSLGYINTNNIAGARTELDSLNLAYENLSKQNNKAIEAAQVAVQVKTVNAWIGFKEGNKDNALRLMKEAADREDGTEKHPVTPGEVYPARELLAEMLLQMNKPAEALVAFETDLVSRPKRFNALYGAGLAAERSGDKEKARNYFNELLQITEPGSERKEIAAIRSYASRQ